MKILDVMKKVALPALGLIAGTVLATKSTDALSSCFGNKELPDMITNDTGRELNLEFSKDRKHLTIRDSEETE